MSVLATLRRNIRVLLGMDRVLLGRGGNGGEVGRFSLSSSLPVYWATVASALGAPSFINVD